MRRGRLRCPVCRFETSATAGTIFADTKLPLSTWLQTVWLLTNQKHGTSALDLQRAIGMSYETAWTVLHKLRRAMVREGRESVAGVVEVDESYLVGVVPGRRGRGALGKAIVAISVERLGIGEKSKRVALGRARLQRVPNVQVATLTDFVLYLRLGRGDLHRSLGRLQRSRQPRLHACANEHLRLRRPSPRRDALRPSRRLTAEAVVARDAPGGVSIRQLDYYLDEFVFRFNRRTSGGRGLLFYRLMEQAVATTPKPGKIIIGGRP